MSRLSSKGFLLIEAGVVLAIIAVIVLLSLPHMAFMRKQYATMELQKLHQFIHFASARAVTLGKDQTVNFDLDSHRYWLDDYKETLVHGVQFGTMPHTYGPPSSPKKLVQAALSYPNHQIHCYADGTIQAGTLYLTTQQHDCSYAITIPVGASSFMRMYRYDQGAWSLV